MTQEELEMGKPRSRLLYPKPPGPARTGAVSGGGGELTTSTTNSWPGCQTLFLPGVPVTVSIQVQQDTGTNTQVREHILLYWSSSANHSRRAQIGEKLNPAIHPVSTVVFNLEIKHGPFTWEVAHRFKNFTLLHTKLSLFRAKQHFRLGVAKGFSSIIPTDTVPQLPRFPGRPDTMMTSSQDTEERREALEVYMNQLLLLDCYREHPEVVEFLDVSQLSFLCGSVKGKEVRVKKRHGDDSPRKQRWRESLWCNDACVAHFSTQWGKRWLIVQDTFVLYCHPDTGLVRTVLLFDKSFRLKNGFRRAGSRRALVLENMSRSLYLKCSCKRATRDLFHYIQRVVERKPARDFIGENRFSSFAPERTGLGSWFVDGGEYMAAVADAIEKAKHEIFITDWWLSPDLYLKRGADRDRWQLTSLLRSRAEAGVQISVLLYKEIAAVLSINSVYSKQRLLRHPNIRVARHPDHTPLPSMWAHHEKTVVIDQEIAFLGGIDLCFGRWDNHQHRLTDKGQVDTLDSKGGGPSTGSPLQHSGSLGNLKIINSTRPIIIEGVRSVTALLLQQHGVLDLAVGPALHTLCPDPAPGLVEPDGKGEKLIEEKTFSKSARSVILRMKTMKEFTKKSARGRDTDSICSLEMDREDVLDGASPSKQKSAQNPHNLNYTWPGKDYINWIVRDMFQPELAEQDNADRLTTPRMPWHDIGVGVAGEAAKDVARHFIQRWNSIKREKLKQNLNYPILVPKAYLSADTPEYYQSLLKTSSNIKCQVVRSCGLWSAGQTETESSIQTAMIDTIANARHYIYIENQFFVSFVKFSGGGGNDEVKNGISTAIFDRILRAKEDNSKFRVFVLLPLLPAFEGDVAGETGHGMRTIMHYQYKSMCRGPNSIITRLISAGVEDWHNYIGFYSLRAHDELLGIPVTELIYIHSKLLIADDNRVIISSANVNDRSLLGDRDSEVGVVIDDTQFTSGVMDGAAYNCGEFAGGLRRNLFREHLGLLTCQNTSDFDVTDPISDGFYHSQWRAVAESNTRLYEDLFSVLPSDNVHTRKESKERQINQRPLVETFTLGTRASVAKIQGNLVLFPLAYLEKENLQPPTHTKEGMVSYQLWT